MRNETKRAALQYLADAPTIAARAFLNDTNDETERAEALRLFKALNIKIKDFKRGDRVIVRAWELPAARWTFNAGRILSETRAGYKVKTADYPCGAAYALADIFRTLDEAQKSINI